VVLGLEVSVEFSNVIGQDNIKDSLINSIYKDTVSHAYIFSGPVGIGKKTMARVFAGSLLCSSFSNGNKCNKCLPCRMIAEGSNPDYREIKTDAASIGVDDIRSIQSDIIIKPMYSTRKVYLIIDADKMTSQAQNCLLKTLEEPPYYAVIVLTTSNYDSLIGTVRSRAVKYNFQKNTYQQVRQLLDTIPGPQAEEKDFIASYADGVIGTAIMLAQSEEFVRLRDEVSKVVFNIQNCKMKEILSMYDFFENNKESISTILDVMTLFYRDLLVVKKTTGENVLINRDKKDIIFNNAVSFSTGKLIKNIETIESTRRNIRKNANYRLSIEIMLMKLQEEFV
jgi:DNA polymerase-3 subunit delta'